MHTYFSDDSLLIVPAGNSDSVRLIGEVFGAHKGALAVALTDQRRITHEITLDLTGVHYLANSALETLVALANNLRPPQRLLIRAAPELALRERLTEHGWDDIEALRLVDVC
ncbi:STAS domain-containing protein [Streptomyces sp. NPDC055189]